jgi:putative sporulation protein YyaC
MIRKSVVLESLYKVIPSYINNDDVLFFCIGTDRSTGDCLAPMVGSKLIEKGYRNVIGTLDNPIHAKNLEEAISRLPKNKFIIAIDACLGKEENVGKVNIKKGSILAGVGVGKNLPPVGDYKIEAIVNVDERNNGLNYYVLQSTRLSIVTRMANDIAEGISSRFSLHKKENKVNQLVLSYIG